MLHSHECFIVLRGNAKLVYKLGFVSLLFNISFVYVSDICVSCWRENDSAHFIQKEKIYINISADVKELHCDYYPKNNLFEENGLRVPSPFYIFYYVFMRMKYLIPDIHLIMLLSILFMNYKIIQHYKLDIFNCFQNNQYQKRYSIIN